MPAAHPPTHDATRASSAPTLEPAPVPAPVPAAAAGEPPAPDAVALLSPGAANRLSGAWPDRAYTQVQRLELHSYQPAQPPRAHALVYAGGGYHQLVHDKEGVALALWLQRLGIAAHVVVHRLPGQADGQGGHWPADIALRDGLACLDHLLSLQRPGTTPALPPLFHVGLSSGGHLAGVLACQPHAWPAAGLLAAYAPLNANHRDHKVPAGKPDYPPPAKQAFYDAWPIGIASAPHGLPRCPVFLAYGLHDPVVPVAHALNLIQAMQQTGGEVQAHVFAHAPHGFALRALAGAHDQWPALAARWLADQITAATGGSTGPAA